MSDLDRFEHDAPVKPPRRFVYTYTPGNFAATKRVWMDDPYSTRSIDSDHLQKLAGTYRGLNAQFSASKPQRNALLRWWDSIVKWFDSTGEWLWITNPINRKD